MSKDDGDRQMDPEAYCVLAGPGDSELKVEGSRFLGFALPVDSEAEAEAIIAAARAEHHDARHICYGLRVGLGARRIDRSNDDGEPARTGGFPLWQLLSGEEIENALLYVIRYFGGTKLGMGGLTRAYRDAGRAAIDDATTRLEHPETELTLAVPYGRFDEVEHLVSQLESLRIKERAFAEEVTLTLAIWRSEAEAVRKRLGNLLGRDLTRGDVD